MTVVPAVGLVGLGVMGAALARRLAARGVDVVATSRSSSSRSAPVAGPGGGAGRGDRRTSGASRRRGSRRAAGAVADLAVVRVVLDQFAGTVVHCGGPGAGQVTKAANQLVVACAVDAVAEALALAAASGVLTPAADVVRGHAVALAATMPDVDHAALVTLFAPDGLDALAPPPGGTP